MTTAEAASVPRLITRHDSGRRPRSVSIVVPTYNGVTYVDAAIASAFSQDYPNIEVIAVDDCSSDGTYERLSAYRADGLKLYRNAHRLGQGGNRNRAVRLASGDLIKFLDQDDLLLPGCVSELSDRFDLDDRIGMVFCKRKIISGSPREPADPSWLAVSGTLHTAIPDLRPVNDGRAIFGHWLAQGWQGYLPNWIGEPVAVMASRSHLAASGLFEPHTHVLADVSLWLRILPHALVGFVDNELACYRQGHLQETRRALRSRVGWLDRLWILEALQQDPEVAGCYPAVGKQLRAARREAWRTVAKGGRGAGGVRYPLRPYREYIGWRAGRWRR